jgi:hypothetical protein
MSKITPEAKARCAAHTLKEQLEQLRREQQHHDMGEVEQYLRDDTNIPQPERRDHD